MSSIHYHKYPGSYWKIDPSNVTIRQHFNNSNTYPTATEIKDSLGAVMADVFFSTLTPEVKECIGLGKPLKGPLGSLWTSPLDDSCDERKITVVPSLHLAQSFTHASIMKMGENYEEEQKNNIALTIQQAVADKENEMRMIMEEKVKEMRERTKCEFFELYSLRLKEVYDQLKRKYEELLAEREKLIRQQLEEEKEHALCTLKTSMECEIKNILRELNSSFDARLKFMNTWEANTHHEEFKQQTRFYMKKWAGTFECAKQTSVKNTKKALKAAHVYHNTFTMRMLQRERDEFYEVLYQLLQFFQGRLKDLTRELNTLKEFVRNLDLDNIALLERKAWECVLKDVVDQFQKFINYVLQEVPGQANYLLSLAEICKNRKECLKKIKHKQEHLGSPQMQLPKNWGEVMQEAEEISIPYIPRAGSSVCKDANWESKQKKEETPVEIEESLHKILQEQETRAEFMNWTKYLVTWITDRLKSGDNDDLPQIPKPPSESGSLDSELGRYINTYFKHDMRPRPKTPPTDGLGHISRAVDIMNANEEKNLKIVGEEIEMDINKEGFTDRRINSLVDILIIHPELKNVIIKP